MTFLECYNKSSHFLKEAIRICRQIINIDDEIPSSPVFDGNFSLLSKDEAIKNLTRVFLFVEKRGRLINEFSDNICNAISHIATEDIIPFLIESEYEDILVEYLSLINDAIVTSPIMEFVHIDKCSQQLSLFSKQISESSTISNKDKIIKSLETLQECVKIVE